MPQGVRAALRVGLWASAFAGVPMTFATLYGYEMLVLLGQEQETARLAARYLHGLAWSLAPGWAFIAIRGFMGAVNRPEPALNIMLAAVPVNALLAYGLIHGAFGLPRLDLLGAGLATTIVNVVMLAVALWVAATQRPFKKYRVLGHFWRWDWPLMRSLLVDRPADLGDLLPRIRPLRRRLAARRHDRRDGACRPSDRAADRGGDLHGAVRHLDGGDRARRSGAGARRHAPARVAPASSRWAWRWRSCAP